MLALRSAPVAIRLALAALTLLLALYAAQLVFGFLPAVVADPYMKFVSNVIFLAPRRFAPCAGSGARASARAWLLMGLGVLAWGLGLLYYTFFQWNLETIPVPSLADAGYLMIYPPVFVALLLLYRSRIRGRSARALDRRRHRRARGRRDRRRDRVRRGAGGGRGVAPRHRHQPQLSARGPA